MLSTKSWISVAAAFATVVVVAIGPIETAQAQDPAHVEKIQQMLSGGKNWEDIVDEVLKKYPNIDDATIESLKTAGVDPEFLSFLSMNRNPNWEEGTEEDARLEKQEEARELAEMELERKLEALEEQLADNPEALNKAIDKLFKEFEQKWSMVQ